MFDTSTLWFDAALVLGLFAVGSILFGHFEEHKELVTRKPGRGGAATAVLLATVALGRAALAENSPAHGATGLFLIHAEAPSPDALPEPGPDRRIARYDYSFLDPEERRAPKYLLLANAPDVSLLLAESPETVEGEGGRPELLLQLTEGAAAQMERVTRENIGRSAAFVIDGDVVTAHKIRTVIEGGRIQLSRCTDDACEYIAVRLQEIR